MYREIPWTSQPVFGVPKSNVIALFDAAAGLVELVSGKALDVATTSGVTKPMNGGMAFEGASLSSEFSVRTGANRLVDNRSAVTIVARASVTSSTSATSFCITDAFGGYGLRICTAQSGGGGSIALGFGGNWTSSGPNVILVAAPTPKAYTDEAYTFAIAINAPTNEYSIFFDGMLVQAGTFAGTIDPVQSSSSAHFEFGGSSGSAHYYTIAVYQGYDLALAQTLSANIYDAFEPRKIYIPSAIVSVVKPLYLNHEIARITQAGPAVADAGLGEPTWAGFSAGSRIDPSLLPVSYAGGLTVGNAVLNFGSGATEATVSIDTPYSVAGRLIMLWISADDITSDHTKNDHRYFELFAKLTANATNTGFEIYARSMQSLTGVFSVRYMYG